MDTPLTLQDVASLVSFVAPGYFAIRTYSLVYAKGEKDLSRLLVESIVFSLPLVSIYNFFWRHFSPSSNLTPTSVRYVLPLLFLSIMAGYLASYFRTRSPVKAGLKWAGLPGPDEDFIRTQFRKLRRSDTVTVTLRNNEVFSGVPQSGNVFRGGMPRQYYFNNIAWYNKKTDKWEERGGSLIIDLADIHYMETSKTLTRD
jgi:hypothetical protein